MNSFTAEFSLDGYKALIFELLSRGYEVRDYSDAEPEQNHLVLRHDIDMSIPAALQMGKFEAEMGVVSTYFVLIRSHLYNWFAPECLAALGELTELGHRLGLHFDASIYSDNRDQLEAAAEIECDVLEKTLGHSIEVVSLHRPAKQMIDLEGHLAGRLQTHQARFSKQMGFCSDSRAGWHHGHPLSHEAAKSVRSLQLLTHPIWWTSMPGENPIDRLNRLVDDDRTAYQAELGRNCQPYGDWLRDQPNPTGS